MDSKGKQSAQGVQNEKTTDSQSTECINSPCVSLEFLCWQPSNCIGRNKRLGICIIYKPERSIKCLFLT